MLRTCVKEFGGWWEQHLAFVKVVYNNSYHSTIEMDPLDAWYRRSCCNLVGCSKVFKIIPQGTNLLREPLDKVWIIQDRL